MKKDSRWESLTLEKGEREKLFDEHIDRLVQKKKDAFRSLLEELKDTPLDASFKVQGCLFSEKLPPQPISCSSWVMSYVKKKILKSFFCLIPLIHNLP